MLQVRIRYYLEGTTDLETFVVNTYSREAAIKFFLDYFENEYIIYDVNIRSDINEDI